jgi:hypothetical protein
MSTDAARLDIGASNDHVKLLKDLLTVLQGPFRLLYVLVSPRSGQQDGRYEHPLEFDRDAVSRFLDRYGVALEQDGRHALWIMADDGQLIYSQHNIIYAYGPLDEFERLLIRRDFVMSDFEIPAPHVHYYHNQFDPVGRDILASAIWERFQLEDMDDET